MRTLTDDERNVRDALEAETKAAGLALKAFPKGPMGLTPDSVKATLEYKSAKNRYDKAFAALRAFNAKRLKR